jgi:hypothetical protein
MVAPKAEDTPRIVTSNKLAAMIGTKAVGLHQGQRPVRRANRPDI